MATQEIINIGTLPNDGEGDPLRVAFGKINNNFSNLFSTFVNTSTAYSFGDTPNQVIFETPANTFTQGQFYIQTINGNTADSQSITLNAQINNSLDDVKFTGYATTVFGNALVTYDMDYFSGNIRIKANPLVDEDMTYLVSSQIMWIGPEANVSILLLDGYNEGGMSTENDIPITTE